MTPYMTHREKAWLSVIHCLVFAALAIGMTLIMGVTDNTGPSIIAAMVISLVLGWYGGDQALKHLQEGDHGTAPPEDGTSPPRSAPDDR